MGCFSNSAGLVYLWNYGGAPGNRGFGYLWAAHSGITLSATPALWLIPAAVRADTAYLNRDDFTESDDRDSLVALVTIYASSTADIFINGVANSPWRR